MWAPLLLPSAVIRMASEQGVLFHMGGWLLGAKRQPCADPSSQCLQSKEVRQKCDLASELGSQWHIVGVRGRQSSLFYVQVLQIIKR